MENKKFIYRIMPKRADFPNNMTGSESRIMAEHFAYLKNLLSEKKLVLAGPCTDGAFGIVILENASEDEAREIMQNDPAVAQCVMDCELHGFRMSLVKEKFLS